MVSVKGEQNCLKIRFLYFLEKYWILRNFGFYFEFFEMVAVKGERDCLKVMQYDLYLLLILIASPLSLLLLPLFLYFLGEHWIFRHFEYYCELFEMVAVKGELNHLKVRRYDLYLLLLDIFSFPTSPFSSTNILPKRAHWIHKKLSIWFWPFWNGIRKGLM